MNKTCNPYVGPIALIGRILIAVLFLGSGFHKLVNPAATQAYITSVGVSMPVLAYYVSLVAEIGCGTLLLIGYRTRFAAFGLALFTAAAAALFHSNFADQNQMIHFMKNIGIIGGLLQSVAFGAGPLSLDRRREKAIAQSNGAGG